MICCLFGHKPAARSNFSLSKYGELSYTAVCTRCSVHFSVCKSLYDFDEILNNVIDLKLDEAYNKGVAKGRQEVLVGKLNQKEPIS